MSSEPRHHGGPCRHRVLQAARALGTLLGLIPRRRCKARGVPWEDGAAFEKADSQVLSPGDRARRPVLCLLQGGLGRQCEWLPAPASRTPSGLAPLERRVSEGETWVVRGAPPKGLCWRRWTLAAGIGSRERGQESSGPPRKTEASSLRSSLCCVDKGSRPHTRHILRAAVEQKEKGRG